MRELTQPPAIETAELTALRAQVRDWLDAERDAGGYTPQVDSWMSSWDQDFSRKLAEQGWVGMTIPAEYGGRGKGFLERFVVTEELLAAGAPVTAHWFSDRQIAPSLLRFGTEKQKERFLPGIAAADILFAIGMSETDSGSDLASVRTRGTRVEGGWTVSGQKVWTSNAHLADWLFVLARTSPLDTDHRHAGLSQFIIDLRAPGVTVRPIVSLNGEHHFNEVFLDEVFVPDELVLGTIGEGWQQVTSELAFERSGPERFLSTNPLFEQLLGSAKSGSLPAEAEFGRYFARISTLHAMSTAVAGALAAGEPANVAAAVVKDLGTMTEGDIAEWAGELVGDDQDEALRSHVDRALLTRPGYTLRGGTNEILRGVVAREMGLR